MKTIKTTGWLLIVGWFLTSSSCKKDDIATYSGDYELSGRVLDEITGKPIPFAQVGVLEINRDQTSHLGTKTAVAGYADVDGKFALKFMANTGQNNYELTAMASKYFDKGGSGDKITLTNSGKKNQDVSLLPEVYLTCNIKGNKGGARLNLSVTGGGNTFNIGVDTCRTYNKLPDRNIVFVYLVSFPDTSLNYKKIVELQPPLPHDTIHYLIEF